MTYNGDTRYKLKGKLFDHVWFQSSAVCGNLIHVFLQIQVEEFKDEVELQK
jgi:hypothetical protein